MNNVSPVLIFSSHVFVEAGYIGWAVGNMEEPNLVKMSPKQPSAYYFSNPNVLSWLFCVKKIKMVQFNISLCSAVFKIFFFFYNAG